MFRSPRVGKMVLLAGLALGGLPADRAAGDGDPAGKAPAAYRVIPLDGVKTGWIVGRCRIVPVVPRWTVPARKPGARGTADVPTERMIASADGGLANCVVYLKQIVAGKDWPEAMRAEAPTADLEVGEGRYTPHVSLVRAGTQIAVSNHGRDEFCVHAYRETLADTQFNFASGPGTRLGELEAAFLRRPGRYLLRDDCHPAMSGYVLAFSHPYFALTTVEAADDINAGLYELLAVLPGEYEVVCWHEGMGETPMMKEGQVMGYDRSPDVVLTRTVKITGGEWNTVDFDFPAPPERVPAK